ncbi:MAG: beta-propeller domain-containing protein, partial [Halobacteria archaeon]|nr:beta-propeller domain-containing protein [Halobacteria archaeon]
MRGGENPDRAVTRVIDALPPEEAKVVSNVSASGDLFLTQDTLVVISKRSERVLGYDVSQPESPEKKWSMSLNSSVVTARLYDDRVYLVLRESIDRDDPCPVRPLEPVTGDL